MRAAIKSESESFRHKPLSNILNCLGTATEGLGNPGVSPSRAIGIGLQKDLSSSHLLGRTFELPHNLFKFLAFDIT